MIYLYHGTNQAFTEPDPELSRPCLDFGRGFYLTPDAAQASGMARRKQLVLGGEPIVMAFEFDDACMDEEICPDILRFDSYSLDWAAFVLRNRNGNWGFSHNKQIVVGPVADGRMPSVIENYLEMYPLEQDALDSTNLSGLLPYLIYPDANMWQYCFCQKMAIKKYLKLIDVL